MLMERYARTSFASQEDFEANYHITVPANFNFAFDCVDELARTQPDKVALVWCNHRGVEAHFTFAQLSRYSSAAARFLAQQGIGHGDVVMLMMKRRVQYWFAMLALMKLGAVAIPATHMLAAKDISYRNNAAGVAAIITTEETELMDTVDEAMDDSPTVRLRLTLGTRRPGWTDLNSGIALHLWGEAPPRTTQNEDMMLLYFTSGTTGMPKMVAHNYTYPLAHITTARFWHRLHPRSLHLTLSDTGWAKAAWGKMYGQWLCEAAVFVYDHDNFNAGELLQVMARHRVTSFCAPPTVFRLLVKMNLAAYDLSALEHVTTAGEPLNPEVFNRFREKTGLSLHEAYGQTEMAPMVITTPYMEPRPGALGRPSPVYRMLLLDENGQPVPTGQEGEICIDTRPGECLGVFMGYQGDDVMNAKAWRGGVYHTGDKARMDEDGYLWFISRVDDVIKSSGYRIGPFEVESVLMEHPAVLECAVTGVPDPLRGQAVMASVILAEGYSPTDALKRELQNHVRANTAAYKCPKIVRFVDAFPKTISGKIQRMVIRSQTDNPTRERVYVPTAQ